MVLVEHMGLTSSVIHHFRESCGGFRRLLSFLRAVTGSVDSADQFSFFFFSGLQVLIFSFQCLRSLTSLTAQCLTYL